MGAQAASVDSDGEQLRLLAVHAHPDDESSKGAATSARYAAEGVDVLVATFTGGERGDILNPHFGAGPTTLDEMAQLRRREMAAAARALGVRHQWLGFVDSGLPEGDPLPPLPEGSFASLPLADAAAPLVELIREFRPHVVTSYDPTGGYPHPDHIMCHLASMEAFEAAADPTKYVRAGGAAPWAALKLYYNRDFSMTRIRTLHEAMVEAGLASPFAEWMGAADDRGMDEQDFTTRIPVTGYYQQRDAALIAHASQIDPNGFFFAIPRDLEARVWGVEEFELGASRIPTSAVEDDLFAGIRKRP